MKQECLPRNLEGGVQTLPGWIAGYRLISYGIRVPLDIPYLLYDITNVNLTVAKIYVNDTWVDLTYSDTVQNLGGCFLQFAIPTDVTIPVGVYLFQIGGTVTIIPK